MSGVIEEIYVKEENLVDFVDNEVVVEDATESENIKYEFPNSFCCNKCNRIYDGFCLTCSTLLCILNDSVSLTNIPADILEIKETSTGKGVFLLKTLPKNVIFGPFEGISGIKTIEGSSWKISDNKLLYADNGNWMKYVRASNALLQNLSIFQIEDRLCFQTIREIMEGEELLVYFADEEIQKLVNNKEYLYTPQKREKLLEIFACTLCCLGFGSDECLIEHKKKCPRLDQSRSIKDGTKRTKKKYKLLSVKDKKTILELLENGETVKNVAEKFGVYRSAVYYLQRGKEKIQSINKGRVEAKITRCGGEKNPVLEKCLLEWIKNKRSLGIAISGPLIREKALFFHEKISKEIRKNAENENVPIEPFKASEGWLCRFKARNGIRQLPFKARNRIRQLPFKGEKCSSDFKAADDFPEIFKNILKEGYDLEDVYSAGESGLCSKSLPTKTLNFTEEKEAFLFKQDNTRVTILTCANANGTHQIPLLVIGESEKPPCFKNVEKLPVVYRGQKNAWMNSTIFRAWYENDFIKAVLERKRGEEQKVLLLLHNSPCHPSADDLNAIHPQFRVVYLPSNTLIHPMDQGVTENMKKQYKKIFLRKLLLEDPRDSQDIIAFQKYWNILDTVSTAAYAWSCVPQIILTKAWKKILGEISNPVADTLSSELNNLVKLIPADHSLPEEIQNWIEDGKNLETCREIADEEIVRNSLESENSTIPHTEGQSFPEGDHDSSFDDSLHLTPSSCDSKLYQSAAEAYKHFANFTTWYATKSLCTAEELSTLYSIQNKVGSMIQDVKIEK